MSKKRAFTLVELLVVIAIIALLMSVLMPALAKAKKVAINVLDQSNQKQLGVAFSGFVNDNDGQFWKGWVGSMTGNNEWWLDAARPYYGNQVEVRCCPYHTDPQNDPEHVWIWHGEDDYGSYGENGWVDNAIVTAIDGTDDLTKNWKTMDVKGSIAGNVPLLCDEPHIDAWPEPTDAPPAFDDMPWQQSTAYKGMGRICRNWHKDGYTTMIFMDLSSRRVGLKELWMLKWHRKFNTTNTWTKPRVRSTDWPKWMRDFKNY